MNRHRQYIGIFLAILVFLVVGCQKSDVFDTSDPQTNQLRFSASIGEAQTATRARESTNDVLKVASAQGVKPPHIVIETYKGTPGNSLEKYFSDELGYISNGNYWDVNSGNIRFLPVGGMSLYAYFATDFADRGELTNITYHEPTSPSAYPSLTYTVENNDALHQVDLIAAKIENTKDPNLNIHFRHILSQINFGVKGINRHKITIKNIRIKNITGKGRFDYNSWLWTPDATTIHEYPYYFPDRNESGGTGSNYTTQGTSDDSKNSYIFGDGGKFGPGSDNTCFYAQIEPSQSGYKTVQDGSSVLHNSLMLIPQDIKKNPNATVTFDYEIKVDGVVIRSAVDCEIRLDEYYDWKPNLRYVYLFQFDDPSEKITFDVAIQPWDWWDGENGTGIKNGTIQEPTQATLNSIGDGEILYLTGILERNLTWNWSIAAKYNFANLNTLTLNFTGVETNGFDINIVNIPGFTITNDAIHNIRTLKRDTYIFVEPTPNQLNALKNTGNITLYGSLEAEQRWDWSDINFTSLTPTNTFTINFSGVIFSSGQSLVLTLPAGMAASGVGISGSNPYTVSAPAVVTVKDSRTRAIIEPTKEILNVISNGAALEVNGGHVADAGMTWDWSGAEYTFVNLDQLESFAVKFNDVTFPLGKSINLKLPTGFRAYTNSNDKQNPYNITKNETVTIRNNRMIYPTEEQVNAQSNGSVITLAGEKATGGEDLDWSSDVYSFPYLTPQALFNVDATNVDFFNPITLKLPYYFVLSVDGATVTNPYTLSAQKTVVVRNDKIRKPSDVQINNMENSNVFTINGGQLFGDDTWDWSGLEFKSLGGGGNRFTLMMSGVSLNSYALSIKLPDNYMATGNVTLIGANTYKINSGDGNVLIVTLTPTTTELNAVINGGNLAVNGNGVTLQQGATWDFTAASFSMLGGLNNSFTLTVSNIIFNSKTITMKLPAGLVASGANVSGGGNTYTISNNTTITIKDTSTPLSSLPITDAGYYDLRTAFGALTSGQTLILSGVLNNKLHMYAATPTFATDQSVSIDLTRLQFSDLEIWSYGIFGGYTITASPNTISWGDMTYSIVLSGPCVLTFTKK